MGFIQALSVALALTLPVVWGYPQHNDGGTLHSNTSSSALQTPQFTNPSAVTTIVAPSSSCVGITTRTLPTPELTITTTITENYTVTLGPTESLPPFTLITPLPACSTVMVQGGCGQEACFRPFASPVGVFGVTKKTPVPFPTFGPSSFETAFPFPPPESTHEQDEGQEGVDVEEDNDEESDDGRDDQKDGQQQSDGEHHDNNLDPNGPTGEPGLGELLSEYNTILPTPEELAPTPAAPSPLSGITLPPKITNVITIAGIPVTAIGQTEIIVGSHSITLTRDPEKTAKDGADPKDKDKPLGPTTTITISGQTLTIAAPSIFGPSTTLILNPHFPTEALASTPAPVSEGGRDSSTQPTATGNLGNRETSGINRTSDKPEDTQQSSTDTIGAVNPTSTRMADSKSSSVVFSGDMSRTCLIGGIMMMFGVGVVGLL